MKILITVLITILILILAGLILMFSGAINVSVLKPQSPIVEWFLSTTSDRSIDTRARNISVPSLQSEEMIKTGTEHYLEMCQICHGAPGISDTELAQGLEPKPPHLYDQPETGEGNEAHNFWVIKNGIMMTAMPAWGVTHSDEKIWTIVAFVTTLPEMTAEEYHQLYEQRIPMQ